LHEPVCPRKIHFDDVYNGGSPRYKITEYPENSGFFYIIGCAEHDKAFWNGPVLL
jgi:hypothetical protein